MLPLSLEGFKLPGPIKSVEDAERVITTLHQQRKLFIFFDQISSAAFSSGREDLFVKIEIIKDTLNRLADSAFEAYILEEDEQLRSIAETEAAILQSIAQAFFQLLSQEKQIEQ